MSSGDTAGFPRGAVENWIASSIACTSFYDIYGFEASLSDQTINLQDGLFTAQRKYYAIKGDSTDLDDQFLAAACVDFVVPFRPVVTNPIIVPEHVRLVLPFGLALGTLTGGTQRDFYDGNPTTAKVLANPCFPMIMVPHGATIDDIILYCKNGIEQCSGLAWGKNWYPTGVTIVSGGSGYQVGNILTLPQPSMDPYIAPQVTVSSVNGAGAITGVTLSRAGSYAVPPGAQARYWTVDYGYAGAIANGNRGGVFTADGSGVYVTSGGAGSGATFSLAWAKDFAGGGGDFNRGSSLLGSGRIGDVMVLHASKANDATYGRAFGFTGNGLQLYAGKIVTDGGYYGIDNQITDAHFDQLKPISAAVNLSLRSCSNFHCENITLDTWDVAPLQIDKTRNSTLRGNIFHNGAGVVATAEPVQLGQRTFGTADNNQNCLIDFTVQAGGTTASVAMAKLGYSRDCTLILRPINTDHEGNLLSSPYTSLVTFTTGWDASNRMRVDKAKGANVISTGALTASGLEVFDTVGFAPLEPVHREAISSLKSGRNLANGASSGAVWKTGGSGTWVANQQGYQRAQATLWTMGSGDLNLQQVTASANQQIYIEAWIKAASGTPNFFLVLYDTLGGSNYAWVNFRSSNGTVLTGGTTTSGSGALVRYDNESLGGNWFRMWMVATVNAANPLVGLVQNPGQTGALLIDRVLAVVAPVRFPPLFVQGNVQTAGVSTSATAVGYAEYRGQLFRVSGIGGSGGNKEFSDVIMVWPGSTAVDVIRSGTGVNTPDSRAYSVDTTTDKGAVKLAMGAGTYAVALDELSAFS